MSIKDLLSNSNTDYRNEGDCELTDEEYDFLMEKYGDAKQKSAVGIELTKEKVPLPVKMGSLVKIKTSKEIDAWLSSKNIKDESLIIITPKFDGLSLLVEFIEGKFAKAYTRGNGIEGQDVTEHFAHTSIAKIQLSDNFSGFVYGEAIMCNSTFGLKYSSKYKNPRNMVAGLLNRKKTVEETNDILFMAFGIKDDEPTKAHQLEYLNKEINCTVNSVPFTLIEASKLSEVLNDPTTMDLIPTDLQCDGLVVELNRIDLQEEMGKETNSLNPSYGRAWKPESVNQKVTQVRGVRWQISKAGYLKPVVEIEPVDISGVTISNVTGNNAKYIKENNIQEGTVVTVIRAGTVIPKIVRVVDLDTDKSPLPTKCPCCSSTELSWSDTNTELICTNKKCSERVISALVHFFDTLDIDAIREGTIKQLYLEGYDTVESICMMTALNFEKLDGFQRSKAENCYNAIRDKAIVDLEKLQHATNFFEGLGSRKLKMLREYNSSEKIPDRDTILAIDGFAETSADIYFEGIYLFWQLKDKLPFKIKEITEVSGGIFEGKAFVFTGFRDKELQEKIELLGGKIASGVSKKTAYLVCSTKGSGSAKEAKALECGAIILDRSECIAMVAKL